jgi:hypothetical protein
MVEVEIQIAIEVNDDGMIPLNSKKGFRSMLLYCKTTTFMHLLF